MHDTYFVVAHFHYIMVGGTVMAYLGGIHFWWPKMTGRMYPEIWGKLVGALIVFVGFNLTFFPQFVLGYLGMPRRYYEYPPEFQVLNVMSTAGASILAVGYLLPLVYLLCSLRYGAERRAEPVATRRAWSGRRPRRRRPTTSSDAPIVTEGPTTIARATEEADALTHVDATADDRVLLLALRRPGAAARRAPRWGCGPSWPPRSCSSAACSPPTSSTASPYPDGVRRGQPPAERRARRRSTPSSC